MKKLLSTATLLLSIATPRTAYSVEVRYNTQTTSTQSIPASTNLEVQKPKNIRTASFTRRACSVILDFIIMCAIVAAIGKIFGIKVAEESDRWGIPKSTNKGLIFEYIVMFLLELISIGRYILSMKIVDASGKDATYQQLFIRAVGKKPPFFLFALVEQKGLYTFCKLWYLLAGISTLAGDNGRGIPDWMANTAVVKS